MINPKINLLKNLLQIAFDKIKGVKYSEKTIIEIDLNDNTSFENIKAIISKMDYRTILKFYDAFYDLPPDRKPISFGDTGAFTDVRKDRNKLKVRLGNHLGYKKKGKWAPISEEELTDRIFKSRKFNGGKIKMESRPVRKQWIRTEEGKALYEFYHDIADKETLC